MRWTGMPMAMWAVFARSFQTQLTAVLGYDAVTAKQITKTAKPKYKEIIAKLPKFEKGDRFSMNIIGCAMLGAFVLCMPKRPDTEALTVYYENAQMTPLMKWFCRKSGKSKFTAKDIRQQLAVLARPQAVEQVIAAHHRQRLRLLHADFKALEVDFAQRALGHAGIRVLAVCLLVVAGKMLHGCGDVLRLDAAYHGCAHFAGEQRIFRIVFKIPPAQRVSLDIHSRCQPQINMEFFHFM